MSNEIKITVDLKNGKYIAHINGKEYFMPIRGIDKTTGVYINNFSRRVRNIRGSNIKRKYLKQFPDLRLKDIDITLYSFLKSIDSKLEINDGNVLSNLSIRYLEAFSRKRSETGRILQNNGIEIEYTNGLIGEGKASDTDNHTTLFDKIRLFMIARQQRKLGIGTGETVQAPPTNKEMEKGETVQEPPTNKEMGKGETVQAPDTGKTEVKREYFTTGSEGNSKPEEGDNNKQPQFSLLTPEELQEKKFQENLDEIKEILDKPSEIGDISDLEWTLGDEGGSENNDRKGEITYINGRKIYIPNNNRKPNLKFKRNRDNGKKNIREMKYNKNGRKTRRIIAGFLAGAALLGLATVGLVKNVVARVKAENGNGNGENTISENYPGKKPIKSSKSEIDLGGTKIDIPNGNSVGEEPEATEAVAEPGDNKGVEEAVAEPGDNKGVEETITEPEKDSTAQTEEEAVAEPEETVDNKNADEKVAEDTILDQSGKENIFNKIRVGETLNFKSGRYFEEPGGSGRTGSFEDINKLGDNVIYRVKAIDVWSDKGFRMIIDGDKSLAEITAELEEKGSKILNIAFSVYAEVDGRTIPLGWVNQKSFSKTLELGHNEPQPNGEGR